MAPPNAATKPLQVVSPPKTPPQSRRISPSQYAMTYHCLLINDPQQKLFESVNITRYQNGTRPACETERSSLLSALAKTLG